MSSQIDGKFTWFSFINLFIIISALTSSSTTRVSGFKFESLITSRSDSMFRSGLVNTNKVVSNSFPPPLSEVSSTSSSPIITCDFDTYESTGCEDEEGSYCDTETQRCLCKEGYPIRLLSYCLPRKSIGDDCYTSSQCNQVGNAACFIFGKEYDNERISGGHNVGRQLSNWPTGTCRCNIGYQILPEILPSVNSTSKSFEEGISTSSATIECSKKTVGSWCTDDWDCIKETFNTQCARPQNLCECSWGFYYDDTTDSCQIPKLYESKCTSDTDCSPEKLICSPRGRCVCPKGFHFDVIHPGCKPNDDSSCDFGYKWDEEWGRCIPARSAAAAFPFNQINSRNKSPSDKNSNSGNIPESSTITTSVFKDSSSSSESSTFSTVLFIIVPNMVLFALLGHYCYFRKRDDEDEDADTSDLERGQLRSIRPTHNLFCSYPYRNGHPTAIRNDSIGTCCVGDKILANLVTGHHLHHHHHHLPPSTLVTHDNSELVNGQTIGQESEECTEVKSSAAATGNSSGTSCAVIESHLENDDLPSPANGSSHEISVSVEGNSGGESKKQNEEDIQCEREKVPDPSSSANLSSSSSGIPVLKQKEIGKEEEEEEAVMSSRLSNGSDHSGNRGNDFRKEGEETTAAARPGGTIQGTNTEPVGNEIKASQVIIDDKKRMIDPANCDAHLRGNLVPCEDTSPAMKESREERKEEEENLE